ncbi:hypothetical protein SDC9_120545 [bioreactor metagenome]|uniref:Uncharacterized protein n=1 Tax=bioreactor metagenome TaxID=1076179 RepID=A0A645C9C5_9ZZZZ
MRRQRWLGLQNISKLKHNKLSGGKQYEKRNKYREGAKSDWPIFPGN